MTKKRSRRRSTIRSHLLAGVAAVALLGAGMGGWAATTELTGAVIAPGVVVVDSDVKKVQHPVGGIISELLVHDGDRVKAGQVVVRLDDTQARSTLAIQTKRLDELMTRQAREEAERDGAERIVFPEELVKRSAEPELAELIAAQERLFAIRRDAREGQKKQLTERIAQLRQGVTGFEAQEAAKTDEIEWIHKELDGVMKLYEKNLVQFTRVVALQRDLARAEGDRGQFVASIAESKNKIAEIELQIIQIDEDLRAEVGKDLAKIRAEIAETTEQEISAADAFARIDIAAPQDGTVHELAVHTVGGVVAAGETLMSIVPSGDTLDVEAKIPPASIDQVHVGQKVALKFTSFNQGTTPEIEGTVTVVSADLIQDPKTNEHYFGVRVAIPQQRIKELQLAVIPGMPVEAFIRTDVRSMVAYLMKPLSDQIDRAFRKR
jgi:HlyD family secretion protein